jgi:hypothetical protein
LICQQQLLEQALVFWVERLGEVQHVVPHEYQPKECAMLQRLRLKKRGFAR